MLTAKNVYVCLVESGRGSPPLLDLYFIQETLGRQYPKQLVGSSTLYQSIQIELTGSHPVSSQMQYLTTLKTKITWFKFPALCTY
jgi:hypothetical protein